MTEKEFKKLSNNQKNAIVAFKIFGHESFAIGGVSHEKVPLEDGRTQSQHLSKYTEELDPAFEIVHKLSNSGPTKHLGFSLYTGLDISNKTVSYYVTLTSWVSDGGPGTEYMATGETVAEAISLAGLKAIGFIDRFVK